MDLYDSQDEINNNSNYIIKHGGSTIAIKYAYLLLLICAPTTNYKKNRSPWRIRSRAFTRVMSAQHKYFALKWKVRVTKRWTGEKWHPHTPYTRHLHETNPPHATSRHILNPIPITQPSSLSSLRHLLRIFIYHIIMLLIMQNRQKYIAFVRQFIQH